MCNQALKEYAVSVNATCAYCGKPLSELPVNAEHIKLASKGGKSCNDNIIITHIGCNSLRGTKSLKSFLSHKRRSHLKQYLIDMKEFVYYNYKQGNIVNYSDTVKLTIINEIGEIL